MASIIPGYNYDIFISYRQKDNKGDRWVSRFVESLKTELEATFKEDVSVYFDENPHDRLQDTHDVSKSLEGKLKCLIFIPVISQTYCDPNSYAWQSEFLPFLRMAEKDPFGRDIRLRSGNVAGRILPVRIHDLEQEDIKLFEKETGSVLRAVDFVFKTATGVSRPLKADEDHPQDNINKTFYADQVNKTGHAIKEIILGMKCEPVTSLKNKTEGPEPVEEKIEEQPLPLTKQSFKLTKKHLISAAVILLVIVAAVLTNLKLFRKDKFSDVRDSDGRISLAVIPFENLTGDTTLNWFSRGMSSLLINGLGSSEELAVRDDQTMFEAIESVEEVFTASISPSTARKIAEKTRAKTYITGSYQGRKGMFRVLVNLVDTESGEVMWTNYVEGDLESAEYLNMADSLCIEIRDYLEIKALEQKTDYDFREAYTKSPDAYRYFTEGVNLILNSEYESAISSLKKALEIDSTFTFASFYTALAYNFSNLSNRNEPAEYYTKKAYYSRYRLPLKYQNWLGLWYACFVSMDPNEMLRYINLLEKSGIESRILWLDLGITYRAFFQSYDKAIEAYEKVRQINEERGSELKYDRYYNEYCEALLLADRPGEVIQIAETGLKVNPDNGWLIVYKGSSYALQGDTLSLRNILSEIGSYRQKYNIPVEYIESGLGWMYYLAKDTARMIEHYRKAYNLDPESRSRLANLVWGLVRFDGNIEEGLEITEKVLKEYPDLAWWVWMKGLAFCKLGDYSEGLALLKQADEKYNSYYLDLKNDIKAAELALSGRN